MKYDSILGRLREKDSGSGILGLVPVLFSGIGNPNGTVTPTKPGDLYIDNGTGYYYYNSNGTINGRLRFMTYLPALTMLIVYGSGSPVSSVVPTTISEIYYDNDTGVSYISVGLNNTDWKELEMVLPIVLGGGVGTGEVTLLTTVSSYDPYTITPVMVGQIYFHSGDNKLYISTGLSDTDWNEIGYTAFGSLGGILGSYNNTTYISGAGNPYGIVDPSAYGVGVFYKNTNDNTLFLNTNNSSTGWIQINMEI